MSTRNVSFLIDFHGQIRRRFHSLTLSIWLIRCFLCPKYVLISQDRQWWVFFFQNVFLISFHDKCGNHMTFPFMNSSNMVLFFETKFLLQMKQLYFFPSIFCSLPLSFLSLDCFTNIYKHLKDDHPFSGSKFVYIVF